jgi:hypothetical protein
LVGSKAKIKRHILTAWKFLKPTLFLQEGKQKKKKVIHTRKAQWNIENDDDDDSI